MQDACLQQNYFILSSCVLCQFSCPTSQHQRTTPVIVGQAASRIVLTSSKHYFPAAGRLRSFYCANASQPPSQSIWGTSCVLVHTLAFFYQAKTFFICLDFHVPMPHFYNNTQYSFQQTECFFLCHLSQETHVPNMLFCRVSMQDFKPH